jgi:chorismate mutase
MTTRGIRGAITLTIDEKTELLSATQELLTAILAANPGLRTEDIASALFTVTDDITFAFPAQAARQIGWDLVPMICTREIPVPDSLPFCIRVLIHWNTDIQQSEIHHVYLRDSVKLRPDLTARI